MGEEVDTNFGDVLTYYLSKEIKVHDFFSVVDEVKKQNGLISIPHPFRVSINPKLRFKYPIEKIKSKIDVLK